MTAFRDGDYTTNMGLEDVTEGRAWIAFEYDGAPLDPEDGGPTRRLVPHLYFWKSAQCVRGLALMPRDEPDFWIATAYSARRPKATALTTDSDARYWGDAARGPANEW